jgi:hypothetical protein
MWCYKFYFAGQLIRGFSNSSSKTLAKNAEQQRRRELEAGFHTNHLRTGGAATRGQEHVPRSGTMCAKVANVNGR